MKTPMQEMLEWVRVTLPMDLDTARLIEEKVISMLEKEKEQIMDAYDEGWSDAFADKDLNAEYYNETFNTNNNG